MKHTPTPWETVRMSPLHKGWKGMKCIHAVNSPINHTLAALGTDEQADSNAQFIVKACNNHDALVDALQGMVDSYYNDNDVHNPVDKAEHALSLAKGEVK